MPWEQKMMRAFAMAPVIVVLVLAAGLAIPAASAARTWQVNAEGTGEAPSIQAAMDSAAAGDTISLADGTYSGAGNLEVDCGTAAVTIASASGNPEQCVIACSAGPDCSDECAAFHFRSTAPGAQRLGGVTIAGWCGGVVCEAGSCPLISNCIFYDNFCMAAEIGPAGAGLRCLEDSQPTITDCVFLDNSAMYGAGVLSDEAYPVFTRVRFTANVACGGSGVASSGGLVTLIECEFRENVAASIMNFAGGPAFLCDGSATVTDCGFEGNTCYGLGGAVCFRRFQSSCLELAGCTFLNNRSDPDAAESGGGAIAVLSLSGPSATLDISNCTFVGNSADGTWYGGSALLFVGDVTATVANAIIAFGAGGAVACDDAPAPAFTCCDIIGNVGGDWVDCIADQNGVDGNFSLHPYFCGWEAGNLALQSTSPCLPGNHPSDYDCGGVIGALGQGCEGGPATRPTTWGAVKSLFR